MTTVYEVVFILSNCNFYFWTTPIEEFEEAKEEYNSKQTRENRKIKDYFTHVSNNSKNDLACEIIIELGNKKYWDTKDLKFKKKMTNVLKNKL